MEYFIHPFHELSFPLYRNVEWFKYHR